MRPPSGTPFSIRLGPQGSWVAIASVSLIYAAHWFYGALVSDASMALNIGAALLVLAILGTPRLREEVSRLKALVGPSVLMLMVLGLTCATLTPWLPGGPHPVWAYLDFHPGALTIDKSATTIELIKLLGLACMFVVGLSCGATDERARYAINLAIFAGATFAVWAFLGTVTGTLHQTSGHRLEGNFLNPNTAGTLFALLLLLSINLLQGQFRSRQGRAGRMSGVLVIASSALLFMVCLIDTGSRGAAMGLGGGLLVYTLLVTRRRARSGAIIGILTLAAVFLALSTLLSEKLLDRLFDSHADTVVRSEIWRLHWHAFLASPWFGYGLGTAETVNKSLLSLSNYDVLWNIRAILNVYLQWLEEEGLFGALPMFACIGLVIGLTYRFSQRRTRMSSLLGALLACNAIILVHGTTDFGLEVPSIAAFWAWLLGLQFSLSQGSSRR